MKNFTKPDLSLFLAGLPPIGIWMRSEYENAKNYAQCVDVMHNWYNIGEDTKNIIKKECYLNGSNLLQTLLISQK